MAIHRWLDHELASRCDSPAQTHTKTIELHSLGKSAKRNCRNCCASYFGVMLGTSDAAHTVHPMAGQGMNLGVADSALLAMLLCQSSASGQDLGMIKPSVCFVATSGHKCVDITPIGNARMLSEYERRRRSHNNAMVLSLDVVKAMFASDKGPISALRNIGMGALNAVPFVKVRQP